MNSVWTSCVTNPNCYCGKSSQVLSKEELSAKELTSKQMFLHEDTSNITVCLSSNTYILKRKDTD